MNLMPLLLIGGAALVAFGISSTSKQPSAPVGSVKSATGKRAMVISIGKSQLGHGPDDAYFLSSMGSVPSPKPNWCGHFALWVLHMAGLGLGITGGFRDSFDDLVETTSPEPGDLAFFIKKRHVAIITSVTGEQLETVNGNGSGNVVTLGHPTIGNVTTFYSIEPWVLRTAAADARV